MMDWHDNPHGIHQQTIDKAKDSPRRPRKQPEAKPMTNATLYEIADLREIIDAALEASEGEMTPEIEAALNDWNESFNDKAERVALYICEQEALADAAKAEAGKLATRASVRLRKVESLKAYLLGQMEKVGKTKIEGVLKTVATQKNNPAVKGDLSPEALEIIYANGPAIVKRIPESYKLDRVAALAAHKAGQTLPSGLTVEQSVGLRIR